MRILYVTNSLRKTNGWARYGFDLSSAAASLGHEVAAAVQVGEFASPHRQFPVLLSPHAYEVNPLAAWSTAKKIQAAIDEFRPDVIHFIVEPYVQTLPFIRDRGAVKVMTMHGSYGPLPAVVPPGLKRKICAAMYSRALKRLDRIVAVSRYTKSRFLGVFPDQAGKVLVVNSGSSPLPKVSPERVGEFKRRHGLEGKHPILLTVGAIKHRKGQLDVMKAAKLLVAEYPDLMYLIVGSDDDPAYIGSIGAYARENGLEKNFLVLHTVGDDENLSCAYSACDVFLLTSNNTGPHFEGFGLVVLEANSFGKPAVGSRDCGIEDAIRDGINGKLVGQGKASEISSAIRGLLENPLDAGSLVGYSAGRDWHGVVKEYEKLYLGERV